MNYYIYEITNNINGMKYIGKRSCNCEIEKDGYMGGGTKLKEAKDEFGIHNFSKKILAVAFDESMALDLESYYIEKVNAVESDTYYNQVYGGDISHMFKHHDEEKLKRVRKMISEKNKGKNAGINSKVAKKVICLTTGQVFLSGAEASSFARLHRGSVSRACNHNSPTRFVGNHPETGERLEWMYYDEYTAINKGETFEHKVYSKPIRTNAKNVICLDTLEIFESAKEASVAYNLKYALGITRACKHGYFAGTHPETKKRLRWIYHVDYTRLKKGDHNNE